MSNNDSDSDSISYDSFGEEHPYNKCMNNIDKLIIMTDKIFVFIIVIRGNI